MEPPTPTVPALEVCGGGALTPAPTPGWPCDPELAEAEGLALGWPWDQVKITGSQPKLWSKLSFSWRWKPRLLGAKFPLPGESEPKKEAGPKETRADSRSCHPGQSWMELYDPAFLNLGFPSGSDGKESACDVGDLGLLPGSGRSPGGGHWQPTLVLLPGESHGQRTEMGYSPWGRKESDTVDRIQSTLATSPLHRSITGLCRKQLRWASNLKGPDSSTQRKVTLT